MDDGTWGERRVLEERGPVLLLVATRYLQRDYGSDVKLLIPKKAGKLTY